MKILSAETNLGSATNVSNSSVVRLFNSGDSNILVTRKDYNAVVVGSFMVPAGEVVYTEKYFTDTLEGSADVKATKTAYSSMMSFVGSSSSGPTYTLSVSASAVDEGGNFTTTVTTTNVDDGTSFNYVLSGTNITSADFSSGSLTGTITISNNTASFSHIVAADTLTEGTETVTIRLIDSSLNYVGNTITVTLNDTSLTPTYTTSLSHTIRDEGDSFTTTMTTTNVADSTELWWELSGTGIAADDFSSGALTGSGTIASNTFNFSHTIDSDNTTEGEETLSIKFYSDSGRTTQVGGTLTCTINDTSLTPSNPCGGSVVFDGSGDTLQLDSDVDYSFGTGDFTVEAWVYRTGGFFTMWDHTASAGTFTIFSYSDGTIQVYNQQFLTSGVNPGFNSWFHLAVVRQSGVLMFFINGVKASTTHNWTYNIGTQGTAGIRIGRTYWYEMMHGYLSNLRAVKGQAIYTSNFTPSTTALTVTSQGATASNVVFLGLQSDTDVTAYTKIASGSVSIEGGDPTAQSAGPFFNCPPPPVQSYSVAFDGSGDYMTAASSNFAMGTGEFTIECWVRFANTSNRGIWQLEGLSTNYTQTLSFAHNGSVWHGYKGGGTWNLGTTRTANQWYHTAYVRSGSTVNIYVDGTSLGSWTDTYDYTGTTISIGGYYTTSYLMLGNISNLRVVKGSAVYTSNFTPPTSPLDNISGTALLCLNQSGSITGTTVGTINNFYGNPTASSDHPWE